MRIVILGGGVAGTSAAQAARETNPEAEITLVAGEERLPYYRTRLLELLSATEPPQLSLRSEAWYVDQAISLCLCPAIHIDPVLNLVQLQDGSQLCYDRLVLATGSESILPNFAGQEHTRLTTIHNWQDVLTLKQLLQQDPAADIAVLGDGPLAVETAWQLAKNGNQVCLLARGRQLLPKFLDKEGSVFFLHMAERAGLRVALKSRVQETTATQVRLHCGRAFAASLLVVAVGQLPALLLPGQLNLEQKNGILVDAHMQTSTPHIYAAGDCAEFPGQSSGRWEIAMRQGAVAGSNAAGGDAVYQPKPLAFTMQAMGVSVWSYGQQSEDGKSMRNLGQRCFGKLFFAQQRLVGAETIGMPAATLPLSKAVDDGLQRWEACELLSQLLQKEG